MLVTFTERSIELLCVQWCMPYTDPSWRADAQLCITHARVAGSLKGCCVCCAVCVVCCLQGAAGLAWAAYGAATLPSKPAAANQQDQQQQQPAAADKQQQQGWRLPQLSAASWQQLGVLCYAHAVMG
jgi:hypothetical protein